MPFLDSLDIANRAVQMLGGEQISSPTEDSSRCKELSFAYDKLKRAELQRNVWTFATKKAVLRAVDIGTMVLSPAQWNSTEVYLPGAIVADANNQYWVSTLEENTNNPPGGNNTAWEGYFGPSTVTPFIPAYPGATVWSSSTTYNQGAIVTYGSVVYTSLVSVNLNNEPDTSPTQWEVVVPATAYYAGELVYIPGSGVGTGPTYSGGYQIYMSLANNNTDTPNIATPWSSTTVYYGGQQITYGGNQYVSIIEYNLGNTPQAAAAEWSDTVNYSSGNIVAGSDNFLYTAVNDNIGFNPVGDTSGNWSPNNAPNAWSLTGLAPSDIQWVSVQATMRNLLLIYPVGSGPSSETWTKNVFRLPSGYLRQAIQDPKAGSVSILGAPTGAMYKDWAFEGDFLVSMDTGPIVFRFVADISEVNKMHDLFCEGLACRCAVECCEKLTQSDSKVVRLTGIYQKFMTEARQVNAIETGADEPPMDDWISTRL